MIVRFVASDGTEKVWEKFKPDRMMNTEAEVIEKLTGMTFSEWGQALLNGSALAGRALVFILQKRDDPSGAPRFRDVVFPVGDLSIDLDEAEKALVREALDTADLSEEDREQAMKALGPSPAATEAPDEEPEDGQGNARSGSAPA